MVRLVLDDGGPAELKCRQALGDNSPLAFDENGHAYLDDQDDAELIAALHKHVSVEPAAPGPEDVQEEKSDEFNPGAFVDRTPMGDVIDDVESGEYDAHLDEIEAEADRQGVLDAVTERQSTDE